MIDATTFKPPTGGDNTSKKPAKTVNVKTTGKKHHPKPSTKTSAPTAPARVRCNECGNWVDPTFFDDDKGVCDNCAAYQRALRAEQARQMSDPKRFTINGVSFTMMPVVGGDFSMGGTDEQRGFTVVDEFPIHQVTLDSYYIGQTEVTVALWRAVMGDVPPYENKDDDCPVVYVSWNDCQKFISKLNAMTGENFRLPTEAEWEFAARGGNSSRGYRYAGGNTVGNVAWYWDNASGYVKRVGGKAANELGLYDMSGNASEWCADTYDAYATYSQNNPLSVKDTGYRLSRGGGCHQQETRCRVSARASWLPTASSDDIGLRLVLPL